jgi:ABC-type multidrug transport system permease subunit
MAPSAVLTGRTNSDVVRNLFVLALMIGVGYLVGFNFQNGVANAILAVALVAAFGYAFSWVFAFIGLTLPNAEAVQAASFLLVFPFTFASSAFVRTDDMTPVLRTFAENQPLTRLINAVRSLSIGDQFSGEETVTKAVLILLAWIVGMLALFVPLAVRRYRRV